MPTHSRVGKSETREMVERDITRLGSRMHEPSEWKSDGGRSNLVFAIAAVAIVAAVVLALVFLT